MMIITSGIYKGRKLTSPDKEITRPTLSKVRMSIFNTLYSLVGDFEGMSFLDLFGGSGIMGLEALSRGFKSVTVCEKNKKSADVIKRNYQTLGIKPNLIIGDSLKFLSSNETSFSVAYIDPPYQCNYYEKILSLVKSEIIIFEHAESIAFGDRKILKEHKYGSSRVTYLKHM